jgi:formylmethanofuran dehydrogenase subunit A
MFATPEWVFKDGAVVARQGRITATPTGGVHFVVPTVDASAATRFAEYRDRRGQLNPRYGVISRDELCACGNGGRLFPWAAAEASA